MSSVLKYDRPDFLPIVAKPTMSVAIIIACRGGQEKLDLTLAALSALNYPANLFSVYIIDDGSNPRLKLPGVRPASAKITYFPNTTSSWGKSEAANLQAAKCKEDIFWFIDADILVDPDHLTHHMKWHHESDDYVVLGWKRFVKEWNYTAAELKKSLKAGEFDSLHTESEPHGYWEARVESTDQFRNLDLANFRALVGATFSISRKNWETVGGYNPRFKTGEDNELGWRCLLRGMRFIPEKEAKSWHLGLTTIEGTTDGRKIMLEHNNPNFANFIPELAHLRAKSGIRWIVPENEVYVDCSNMTFQNFFTLINQFNSDLKGQAHFHLFGSWDSLTGRYKFVDDSFAQLRQIQRWVSGDLRFSFLEKMQKDEIDVIPLHDILAKIKIGSTPFIFFAEGDVGTKISIINMRSTLLESRIGLQGVVDSSDNRAFVLYAPAIGRAQSMPGNVYKNLERVWGVNWATVDAFNRPYRAWYFKAIPFMRYIFRRFGKIRSFSEFTELVRSGSRILMGKFSGRK